MPWARVLAALAMTACGAGDAPTPPAEPEIGAEQRAQLQALGYVELSSDVAVPGLEGVVVHDPDAVQPGYRLYSADTACEAELIGVDGEVVRRWAGAPCGRWTHAQLLANGDLLAPGTPPYRLGATGPSYLQRLGWHGERVWKLPIHAHHDAAPLPDGSLLALTLSEHRDPEVFADGVTIDNPILRIEPDGSLGRSLSLLDGLKSREGACPFRPPVESHPGKADPLHINSIEWVQRPGADFRDGGSARPLMLLCMRHQDCVYLVDWETGDVVWDWGRGELDGPHDATLLANGNVLIFDNGMVRGWSRVIEVDRHSNEIVWEYPGATGEPFFTRGRGGSQRLPNGNTLIAESNEGRAFEVSPSGKIVWEFFNPRYREGHRTAIVRMRHYDADFIESLPNDPR